jgi:hypothetical protein
MKGTGFLGSNGLELSTSNQELIPTKPENWTIGYSLYKFSFYNKLNCTVIVNGNTKLFLVAEQGFNTTEREIPITSFVVVESGINFAWMGAY